MTSLTTDAPIPAGQFVLFFGQYQRCWMYGSFDETAWVAAPTLAATA